MVPFAVVTDSETDNTLATTMFNKETAYLLTVLAELIQTATSTIFTDNWILTLINTTVHTVGANMTRQKQWSPLI